MIKAKKTMIPIFLVMIASPTVNKGSGSAGTKNLRVRKTAIKEGIAKTKAVL